MKSSSPDRLAASLDITVEALAVCDVSSGSQLLGPPSEALIAHYVLAGVLHLRLGEEVLACPAGSIVLVPPGVAQVISADGAQTADVQAESATALGNDGLLRVDASGGGMGDLRFACGAVTSTFPGLIAMMGDDGRPIFETPELPYVLEAFRLMLLEVDLNALGMRALVGALMKSCLVLVVRQRLEHLARNGETLASLQHTRLRRALKAILDQPAAKHTVASLALTAGMSRSCFAKDFMAAFGIAPMAFVTRTRLQHARRLLDTTQVPIKAIAALVGFSNRSHFSRAFRQAHGFDPTAFRKRAPDAFGEVRES